MAKHEHVCAEHEHTCVKMLRPQPYCVPAGLVIEKGVVDPTAVNVNDANYVVYTPVAHRGTPDQADSATVTSHGGNKTETVWAAPNATDSPDASLPFDGAGITAGTRDVQFHFHSIIQTPPHCTS